MMNDWGWRKSIVDGIYRYRVPLWPGGTMCEHLGIVKPRADGRWNWWRKPSQFHTWHPGQGVAATRQEAKAHVEEGWTPPVPVKYAPDQPTKCCLCGHFIDDFPTKTVRLNTLGTHMMPKSSGRITVEVHEACIWGQCYEKYVC